MNDQEAQIASLKDALEKITTQNLKIQILGSILSSSTEEQVIEKIAQQTATVFVQKVIDYTDPIGKIKEMSNHIAYLERKLDENNIDFLHWDLR